MLYREVESSPSVLGACTQYMLYRDYTSISLLLFLILPILSSFKVHQPRLLALYAAGCFFSLFWFGVLPLKTEIASRQTCFVKYRPSDLFGAQPSNRMLLRSGRARLRCTGFRFQRLPLSGHAKHRQRAKPPRWRVHPSICPKAEVAGGGLQEWLPMRLPRGEVSIHYKTGLVR